jgi:single-strand DNA-binding protein
MSAAHTHRASATEPRRKATPAQLERAHHQFQVINLIGRLTQDPQVATRSDTTICKLRVAVNRLPGKNGDDRGANYFDIATFGGLALNCGKYLTKGRRVGIAGRLNHNEWKADDGSSRQRVEIIADNVEFLDGPKRDEDSESESTGAEASSEAEIAF